MPVPFSFGAATTAIPLSQLDSNFNTPITLGNTAIQLGNTVTTLNNMTLANVTISSGNVTITNVTVTTANATTVNTTTLIATTANVTTGNVTNLISGNVTLTGGSITGTTISGSTGSFTTLTTSSTVTLNGGTANGVAYLNGSKVLTTGSALTFDGTNVDLDTVGAKLNFATTGSSTRNYIGGSADGYSLEMVMQRGASQPLSYKQNFSVGHEWGIAGSGAMTLTSTGLGIGTSSPSGIGKALNVYGGAGDVSTVIAEGDAGSKFLALYSGSASNDNGAIYSNQSIRFGYATSKAAAGYTNLATLDTAGNLGLGVTPSAWATYTALQVKNGSVAGYSPTNDFRLSSNAYYNAGWKYISSAYGVQYLQDGSTGQHQWFTAPSGTAGNAITFTQAMTLDASGNLLVGRTSGTGANIDVYESASNDATIRIGNVQNASVTAIGKQGATTYGATTAGDAFLYADNSLSIMSDNASGVIKFSAGGNAERARITSGGDLLVGTTSTILSSKFASVAGASQNGGAFQTTASANTYTAIAGARNGNTGNVAEWWYDLSTQVGTISVTASATAYNTSSDYRLKDNPQPLTNSGAFIDALQPKTWDWKTDGSKGVGFIAHEAQAVSPSSVVGQKDAVDADGKPIYQAMEYGSAEFIANIVAELQSLRARVAQLESKGA